MSQDKVIIRRIKIDRRSTRTVLLKCRKCHIEKIFSGSTLDKIIEKIDSEGWYDSASEGDCCPKCYEEYKEGDVDPTTEVTA